MNWRQKTLENFGDAIVWLDAAEADIAHQKAIVFSSKERYGLEPSHVSRIERIAVNEHDSHAVEWLTARLTGEFVRIVFDQTSVCRLATSFFATPDIFCPSRDDAIIVPESGGWALFYCHEDEFEFGLVR